ncbi:MAG: (deoxy)nucleoside triphosphate pyrophosphohydrolase [Bryobacteraceae bacterium]
MSPLIVVAAVIERDGLILIGQRRRGTRHEFQWEFPGGKLEPGETPAAALRRELAEELAIAAEVGPEIKRYEFAYRGRSPIVLIFFRVTGFSGTPQPLSFEKIVWDSRGRLPDYDFLEGDLDFVQRLSRNDL